MESPQSKQEKLKARAELSFGLPGHEREYTFVPDSDEFIPSSVAEALESELGNDWNVFDRGNRIEITSKNQLRFRDDKRIKSAIERAATNEYVLRIAL